MLMSKFLLPTTKEMPADAVLVSHKLMLRAGMIRRVAAGIYTWLPLGLRVLMKVENIVRDEMNKIGGLEIKMPVVEPAELWHETNRWDKYGKELLKFQDRHGRDFCLGPTHEEVATDLIRNEIKSYKQLPLTVYQIQTKFRDEIRPRFGVMRSREFLMKDAYSFHLTDESLQKTYDEMYQAYTKIFTRLGLKFRAVLADTGSIGGSFSHEFQVLADSGEDEIAYSDKSDYAANVERAESLAVEVVENNSANAMEKIATPDQKTIVDVAKFFGTPESQALKCLMVKGEEVPVVALILRGDHQLNELKAEKLDEIASPLVMAEENVVKDLVGAGFGSLGPVGLDLDFPMIVDRDAAAVIDFNCGANEDGFHYKNVNWGRDVKLGKVADLRNVVEGDASPDGKGNLKICRGIEVGHIFQLGDAYSKALNANVLDENGKSKILTMGCYGIGVSRVVAAAIEQHHDDKGIVWPEALAPFQVVIVPVQMQKSYRTKEAAEKLYQELLDLGVEVLMDDRKERPGVMFAEMDLIGIPHRIVIGERGLDKGIMEYKARNAEAAEEWPIDDVLAKLKGIIT